MSDEQENRRPIVYAFIDSQNLYLGIKSLKWELDYQKLFIYLKEKYSVRKAYYYIGFLQQNVSLYKKLGSYGYDLVYKNIGKNRGREVKGNIDVDLTVDAIRKKNYFDTGLFISADGDFTALYGYLYEELNKEIIIIVPNKHCYSRLLLKYSSKLKFLNNLENKLQSIK